MKQGLFEVLDPKQQFPAAPDQKLPVQLTFLRAGGAKFTFQVELKMEPGSPG